MDLQYMDALMGSYNNFIVNAWLRACKNLMFDSIVKQVPPEQSRYNMHNMYAI